jgi:hypothetical protein
LAKKKEKQEGELQNILMYNTITQVIEESTQNFQPEERDYQLPPPSRAGNPMVLNLEKQEELGEEMQSGCYNNTSPSFGKMTVNNFERKFNSTRSRSISCPSMANNNIICSFA